MKIFVVNAGSSSLKYQLEKMNKDPQTALLGGTDGLKFYRAITENYKRYV